jgi:hypothetical protein
MSQTTHKVKWSSRNLAAIQLSFALHKLDIEPEAADKIIVSAFSLYQSSKTGEVDMMQIVDFIFELYNAARRPLKLRVGDLFVDMLDDIDRHSLRGDTVEDTLADITQKLEAASRDM